MKVLIFSGNRADWSGLEWLGDALRIAGHEVQTFKFWEEFEGKPNTPSQVAEVAGLSFHQATIRLPGVDLVFLAGDRYEILAAAQAAYLLEIPIAHIAGGDVTLGSRDNAMRDAISMLASVHFVTNERSGVRLVSMGIEANRIHHVGAPAIDRIISVAAKLSANVTRETSWRIIVSVHPSIDYQVGMIIGEVLTAIDMFVSTRVGPWAVDLITPNVDAGNEQIAKAMQDYCRVRSCASYHENMPPDDFIRLLAGSAMIVGNSSAGMYEAPIIGIPTVNVGKRQEGRLIAPTVACVPPDAIRIRDMMIEAAIAERRLPSLAYGDGHACDRIVEIIGKIQPQRLRAA